MRHGGGDHTVSGEKQSGYSLFLSFVARKVELMAQERVLSELIELITGLLGGQIMT